MLRKPPGLSPGVSNRERLVRLLAGRFYYGYIAQRESVG